MDELSPGAEPEWFRWALKQEPQALSLTVEGCAISYRQWGDVARPPVILAHGFLANARWWDHIAPFLACDYRVIALDLSGHGDSGWRPSYSYAMWAEEVRAIAQEVSQRGIAPVVIAHSMGGRVAARTAAEALDSFSGLVLVDTAMPIVPEQPATTAPAGESDDGDRERRMYSSVDEAVSKYRLRGVPSNAALPYILRHVATASLKEVHDGVVWKRDPNVVHRTDARPGPDTLRRIQCRIGWICAEYGKVTQELRAGYPRLISRSVPIVEVPAAHHHMMLDEPLSLVTAIRALLAVWTHSVPAETEAGEAMTAPAPLG